MPSEIGYLHPKLKSWPRGALGLVYRTGGRGNCEMGKKYIPHQPPAILFYGPLLPFLHQSSYNSLYHSHSGKVSASPQETFKGHFSVCLKIQVLFLIEMRSLLHLKRLFFRWWKSFRGGWVCVFEWPGHGNLWWIPIAGACLLPEHSRDDHLFIGDQKEGEQENCLAKCILCFVVGTLFLLMFKQHSQPCTVT